MAFNTMIEDRQAALDGAWRKSMPCHECAIKDVCKHYNAIKRPDFNPDVFTVSVACKIKDEYRRNDNG